MPRSLPWVPPPRRPPPYRKCSRAPEEVVPFRPRYQSRRQDAMETRGDPCESTDLSPSTLDLGCPWLRSPKDEGRRTKDRLDGHRVGRRRRAIRLFVDEVFELFAGLEVRNLLWRHVHLIARLRVPALARLALPKTEAAEPAQLDLFPTMQRVDDALEHRFDDDFGVLLREIGDP